MKVKIYMLLRSFILVCLLSVFMTGCGNEGRLKIFDVSKALSVSEQSQLGFMLNSGPNYSLDYVPKIPTDKEIINAVILLVEAGIEVRGRDGTAAPFGNFLRIVNGVSSGIILVDNTTFLALTESLKSTRGALSPADLAIAEGKAAAKIREVAKNFLIMSYNPLDAKWYYGDLAFMINNFPREIPLVISDPGFYANKVFVQRTIAGAPGMPVASVHDGGIPTGFLYAVENVLRFFNPRNNDQLGFRADVSTGVITSFWP